MKMENKEIKFLEKELSMHSKKYTNVYDYKQYLKIKLKSKYYFNFPQSNINDIYKVKDKYNYFYEYQRYDSKLEYNKFLEKFYGLNNRNSKTIFTNSGMAAITSLIYSIYYNGNFTIEHEKDIYYETKKLINLIYNKKQKKFTKRILYLDSISYNFKFDITNLNRYSILIIDTTCFHSLHFGEIIEKIIGSGKLCIIVRSHTKLDMLGLEYCNQGSLTYIFPESLSEKNFSTYKKILEFNYNYVANSGLNVTENNIFPLLADEKVVLLNKLRIKRINENNEYFYNKTKNLINFKLPNHKLFLLLNVKSNLAIQDLKNKLVEFSDDNFELCKFSPSFGFDYIAIDTYYDDDMNDYTIRISIGDVDETIINNFIIIFKEKIYDKL